MKNFLVTAYKTLYNKLIDSVLPLAERSQKKKQKRIEQVIELAERLEEEQEQNVYLPGKYRIKSLTKHF